MANRDREFELRSEIRGGANTLWPGVNSKQLLMVEILFGSTGSSLNCGARLATVEVQGVNRGVFTATPAWSC